MRTTAFTKIFYILIVIVCISIFVSVCTEDNAAAESNIVPTLLLTVLGQSPKPLTILEQYPIDGDIDFSKLKNIQEETLTFLDIPGFTPQHPTNLKWAMANDDKDLYLAIEWTDDDHNSEYSLTEEQIDYDGIQLLIDNDGNGTFEKGEDNRYIIAASIGSLFVDSNRSIDPAEEDIIGNGMGYLKYHETENKYQAEFYIPLQADANNQDANITSNTKFNIILSDHCEPKGGEDDTLIGFFTMLIFDEETDSTNWPTFSLVPSDILDRPKIPNDLEGLIVFSSKHEHAKGEIYSFDPQTKNIVRITNNELHETTVSLSHNRQTIAFLGAPEDPETSTEAALLSEIYTINVDGTGLTQLTDNDYMDGHPAWSPDDLKIVYGANHPDNFGFHIMLMNTDGSNKTDLTLLSDPDANTYWCDEMDPEWLPDGSIVFKTNRFLHFVNWTGNDNELQIAVMNSDGTNVQQITFQRDVVDHDPVGDLDHTVFERLIGNYNYLSLEGIFAPWQIVEARLNGTNERILVDDMWVNWLPVYDPTGQYILYFRVCGYTEARLMTRAGKDLGRLIPGVTKFIYFDWK